VQIEEGQQKNKNRRHQPTIKFMCFLPINFLPLPAPPYQFSQDIGKWQENQILIPDWTYFHCPGATLPLDGIDVNCHSGCGGSSNVEWTNKNCLHQPTIKFTGFLPINFLPLLAPP